MDAWEPSRQSEASPLSGDLETGGGKRRVIATGEGGPGMGISPGKEPAPGIGEAVEGVGHPFQK